VSNPKWGAATGLVAMLLVACGGTEDSAPGSVGRDAPSATPGLAAGTTWTVTEMGWGPVRAGMSVADARAALGGKLSEPANRQCDYVKPLDGPPGVQLMVVGDQIARVDVIDTTVATAAGARVSDDEARIGALYPGRVRSGPHKYVEGHYLVVRRGTGADSVYRLVFETDGKRVTRFRGGRLPEVEWVEGCG
jgi:hypothetical protein